MREIMESTKKMIINCDICDTRQIEESSLSTYEKIMINADLILTNKYSKAVLSHLPISYNADEILDCEEDLDIIIQNGTYTISGQNTTDKKILLTVNGMIDIKPDAVQVLPNYIRIIVNGTVRCPESLSSYLGNVTINGSMQVYPDDCIVLSSTFFVDKYFSLRAQAGAVYYAQKKVVLTDPEIDLDALSKKGIKFYTKHFVVCQNQIQDALSLVDETVPLSVVPEGCSYVKDSAELSEELLSKYGTNLYIDGTLTLTKDSTPLLERISYLEVAGNVELLPQQVEAFQKLNAHYKELILIKGILLKNKPQITLDNDLLALSPDGISIRNCATVFIDDFVTSQQIHDQVEIKNCAKVICTPQQRPAVQLIASNTAFIGTEQDSQNSRDNALFSNHQVINADKYTL